MDPTTSGPPYEFHFDRHKTLMRVTVRGLWNDQIIADFYRDSMIAAGEAQQAYGSYRTLTDARAFPVQPAQITEGISQLMRAGLEVNPGRSAVVSQSQLSKMQGERLYQNPRFKIFMKEEDALAWLMEPQDPDAA